jgi:pimeloyl-ACP methyl ester carboxylesterase
MQLEYFFLLFFYYLCFYIFTLTIFVFQSAGYSIKMELNFKTFGNPWHTPVVILHGMFGTLDNWQTVAKLLSERYCVYVLDLRNHGRSPQSEDFGYKIMARDVAEFLDAQGLREAHIIGHSMGGKVAMELAFSAPDAVESLVVVDIAPKTYIGHHEAVFQGMFALDPPKLASRQEAENILNGFDLDWATKQFILKNLVFDKDTQGYTWRMNLPVIYAHYAEILAFDAGGRHFDKPTLFLRGSESNYIEVADFQALTANLFPDARLQTIAKAGHWLHADAPQAFVEAIFGFI